MFTKFTIYLNLALANYTKHKVHLGQAFGCRPNYWTNSNLDGDEGAYNNLSWGENEGVNNILHESYRL